MHTDYLGSCVTRFLSAHKQYSGIAGSRRAGGSPQLRFFSSFLPPSLSVLLGFATFGTLNPLLVLSYDFFRGSVLGFFNCRLHLFHLLVWIVNCWSFRFFKVVFVLVFDDCAYACRWLVIPCVTLALARVLLLLLFSAASPTLPLEHEAIRDNSTKADRGVHHFHYAPRRHC